MRFSAIFGVLADGNSREHKNTRLLRVENNEIRSRRDWRMNCALN